MALRRHKKSPSPHGEGPILAVDVDGVISLFGFEEPSEDAPCEFQLIDGMLHCISRSAGDLLKRLSEVYELVWASGWEDRANDHLPGLLDIPKLPYLSFDGRARFGSAHWKLDAIEEFAGDRPLAWIDDSLDRTCFEWAEKRDAPTLLVPSDPEVGIEERHVDKLLSWARGGYTA